MTNKKINESKLTQVITAMHNVVKQEIKAPKYTLGDTVEYLQGTYEVVEVLTEGVHLKNVHKPFNSEVVKYNELTQG